MNKTTKPPLPGKLTIEEDFRLPWPMTDELRMEAAMCLWETAIDVWDRDAEGMEAFNNHREAVGTVQFRHDIMALVEPLHVGWHIHQRAAGDDVLSPFDWAFVPWFLKTCSVVVGNAITTVDGWEDLCRNVRGSDHDAD